MIGYAEIRDAAEEHAGGPDSRAAWVAGAVDFLDGPTYQPGKAVDGLDATEKPDPLLGWRYKGGFSWALDRATELGHDAADRWLEMEVEGEVPVSASRGGLRRGIWVGLPEEHDRHPGYPDTAATTEDKLLFDILQSTYGAPARWELRRERGLTDEELEEAVVQEMGSTGMVNHSDDVGTMEHPAMSYDAPAEHNPNWSGSVPRVQWNDHPKGPGDRLDYDHHVKGEELVSWVRRLLEVPYPEGAEPQEEQGDLFASV